MTDLASGKEHLVTEVGKHTCHCGQDATRLVRCRKCKAVIARCTLHGSEILKESAAHCPPK